MIYLHTPDASVFRPALTLGQDLPKEVAGQPATYLDKDLIHVGEYVHPTKKFHVSVDRKKLDTMVENFNVMLKRGVEVPINVDHSEAADDARGWLLSVHRDGERMVGRCQFIGDDAAKTAARNRVSVGIDEAFIDGQGNKYLGGVIRHVALTPMPVVPDQDPFSLIAASAAAAGGDVLLLAAAVLPITPERSPNMADKTFKCSEDTINSLHRFVPGLAEKTDDEKLGHLGQHVQTVHSHVKDLCRNMGMDYGGGNLATLMSQAAERAQSQHSRDIEDAGGATVVANLSVSQIADKASERRKAAFASIQENTRLRERIEEKDTQIQTLSAATVKQLDPENQASVIESATILAEACVEVGGLNPACKQDLLSFLTKDANGKVNTLAMSSAANPRGNGPMVLGLFRILKNNKPVPLGEGTGLQVLSRVAPGDEKSEGEKQKEAAVTMLNKHLAGKGAAV